MVLEVVEGRVMNRLRQGRAHLLPLLTAYVRELQWIRRAAVEDLLVLVPGSVVRRALLGRHTLTTHGHAVWSSPLELKWAPSHPGRVRLQGVRLTIVWVVTRRRLVW